MAANYMADALNHPDHDVPFDTVGENTIIALTTLAAIFKIKYTKSPAQHIIDSSIKASEKTPCSISPTCAEISNQAQLSNKVTNRGEYNPLPR
jgi:hypothetical protein